VAGLFLLMSVGLAIFGVTMYELYSGSQYRQLSTDLKNAVPLVTQELAQKAGVELPEPNARYGPSSGYNSNGQYRPDGGGYGDGSIAPGTTAYTGSANTGSADTGFGGEGATTPGGAVNGGAPPAHGGSPFLVAPGTYGELLGKSGQPVTSVQLESSTAVPRIPKALLADKSGEQSVHLGSISGSTGWLADIGPRLSNGDRVVVALPTGEVTASLNHLVLIESLGAASLLLILSVGAGFVLRRGLSPLERMADTAKDIAAGDLSQRVEVKQQSTEVGELAMAFNTMLDEIQQAFSERDATEDRLRQFLADASHELRTPLTSIQGFAELFRLGAENPRVDKATIMRRIEEESSRMKGLVEDLLLLARLDQVRQTERAAVDLSVLAADACSDASAAAPGRPVTLHAPQPVVILGVEAHARQALGNLVTNALKHTPPGTAIDVSAQVQGGEAVVSVRDHGPGLDAEALEHVFDRFWQQDPARAGAGAGLGLPIVAAVAAEHDGTVTAANAPGGGAVFTLRLPLVPLPAATHTVPAQAASAHAAPAPAHATPAPADVAPAPSGAAVDVASTAGRPEQPAVSARGAT
jgi:two-component system, OmpR family, sensor kinase